MHAYASGAGAVVVGHPASALFVLQSSVAGGTAGSVTATGPVVAVDSLVLDVACGALSDEHADAATRASPTGTNTSPTHRRVRT